MSKTAWSFLTERCNLNSFLDLLAPESMILTTICIYCSTFRRPSLGNSPRTRYRKSETDSSLLGENSELRYPNNSFTAFPAKWIGRLTTKGDKIQKYIGWKFPRTLENLALLIVNKIIDNLLMTKSVKTLGLIISSLIFS